MRVIVDTREKAPWTFEGQRGITTKRAKLDAGDYSVEGLEARVSIERKSLEDWIGTVLRERQRFYRELELLRAYDFRCVIIETSVRELYSPRVADRLHPAAIMGFVAEVAVQQHVPVLLGGTRAEAQLLAGALLSMAARKFSGAEGLAPAK